MSKSDRYRIEERVKTRKLFKSGEIMQIWAVLGKKKDLNFFKSFIYLVAGARFERTTFGL